MFQRDKIFLFRMKLVMKIVMCIKKIAFFENLYQTRKPVQTLSEKSNVFFFWERYVSKSLALKTPN